MHPHFGLADQLRLDLVSISLVRKELLKALPKACVGIRAAREPTIEHRLGEILDPLLVEQPGNPDKVDHIVADRDARPASPLANRKDAERQTFDRKVAALCGVTPAVHGSLAFGKPAQARS